jgi:hypothetical protein
MSEEDLAYHLKQLRWCNTVTAILTGLFLLLLAAGFWVGSFSLVGLSLFLLWRMVCKTGETYAHHQRYVDAYLFHAGIDTRDEPSDETL